MCESTQFALTDEQTKAFEQRAKALNMSLSDYVEQIIVNGCEPKAKQAFVSVRIDEQTKNLWKENAKKFGYKNLSRFVVSAVNRVIEGGER